MLDKKSGHTFTSSQRAVLSVGVPRFVRHWYLVVGSAGVPLGGNLGGVAHAAFSLSSWSWLWVVATSLSSTLKTRQQLSRELRVSGRAVPCDNQ